MTVMVVWCVSLFKGDIRRHCGNSMKKNCNNSPESRINTRFPGCFAVEITRSSLRVKFIYNWTYKVYKNLILRNKIPML